MKRSILFSFFLGFIAVFLLAACDTRRDDTVDDRTVITDDNRMRDNTDIRTDSDFDLFEGERNYDYYTYDQRDEFKDDVERAIDRIEDRIDRLEDRADDAVGEEKQMYDRRIAELKEKRDNLEKRLDEFDKTNENNWEQFKAGVRTAWTDVKQTWNDATRELRYNDDQNRRDSY